MIKTAFQLFIFVLISFTCVAQKNIAKNISVNPLKIDQGIHDQLKSQFLNYKIVELDNSRLFNALDGFDNIENVTLKVDESETWLLQLLPENRMIDDMHVITSTRGDITNEINVFPYKGYVQNQSGTEVRLTISKDVLYVYLKDSNFERFIEPLRFVIPGVDKNLYLVYNANEVKYPEGNYCSSSHLKSKTKDISNQVKSLSVLGDCFEVEYATASDFSMFTKYNSDNDDVIAHNIGVMNNVQTNYDDEFEDELQFVNVEQWISDCNTCDPWTSSTEAVTLLNSFRDWAPGNFSETHDLGQLWTNRDFDGTTIGIAYVGVICTGSRYQCLQDFTGNAAFLRVLTSHETGHNFDASHDGAGSSFIMAPSVSGATEWSGASIADITNHYQSRSCLAECAPPLPPVSDFTASLTNICPGTTIQFFDNSQNIPTSWNWTFTGGNPSSSSMENPMVTYDNAGNYNVTLITTNDSGTDTEIKIGYIAVNGNGQEFVLSDDFSSGLTNWTVSNPDNSTTWETGSFSGSNGSNDVVWINNFDYNNGVGDFDGLQSPVLDFSGREGMYLELEYAYARYNASNSDRFRIKVSTNGGATYPFTVFDGQETGGGNFATSPDNTAAFFPTNSSEWCLETTYGPDCINVDLSSFEGEDNIRILLENESDFGNNLFIDNVIVVSSCQVLEPPLVNFSSDITSGCIPMTVQFQDLSTNSPTQWFWVFPGGMPATSTVQNPIVTYENTGVYDVSLTASNEVGSNTNTTNSYIQVLDVPEGSFDSNTDEFTVSFTNTSSNGSFFNWDFGDGENSSQENPIHVYDQDGIYDVQLTVGNGCGTVFINQQIVIATLPIADFSQTETEGCADLIVQFTNNSSINADTYLWTFEGGNPNSSTEENPEITYSSRGVYNVTLVASNEVGDNQVVKENLVVVNDVPVTDFSSIANGFTFNFTNLTQFGDSFIWDFGDSNTSNEENPFHTYLNDGEYTVSLIAENECGTFTKAYTIVVSNMPTAGINANQTIGCAEFTVFYSDNSSSNVDSWFWIFEGGQPATSTEQNPIVSYSNSGLFDVSLEVANEEGSDVVSFEEYIEVGVNPTAEFSFTNSELEFMFTNLSLIGDEYSWDFGDSNSSNEENPNHTYSEDGMYTVILSVVNGCGTDQFTSIVNVVSQVESGFTSNVVNGCADLVVQFSNASTTNVSSFEWSFPGGIPASSTETNPVVTYSTAGIYGVALNVSNSEFNDELIIDEYISVSDVPESNFSFDLNLLEVSFNNTSTNGNSYMWDFGDNSTSNDESPNHIYGAEGIYEVTLISTNSCGNDTLVTMVNVSSLPTANFASNIQGGCTTLDIQFEDLSTSNSTSWSWTFEGGSPSTSSEQNPSVSYSDAGIFDVSLTVMNANGADTYELLDYIEIATTPIVSIDQNVDNASVQFNAQSSNTDSYEWIIEELMYTSNEQNPNVSFPADGVYSVNLQATNECGTSTITTAINITAYPDALFNVNDDNICAPTQIQFTDTSLDDATSWLWEFEGGEPSSSNEQNPLILYSLAGEYNVRLIVENNVGRDTLDQIDFIVLDDKPDADFTFNINGAEVSFENTSTGSGSILWDFDDNSTSNENAPIHVFTVAGVYEVSLIIDNGSNCVDTIIQTINTIVDNVDEIEGINLTLFPNPVREQFQIDLTSISKKTLEYELVNILGQRIFVGEWEVNSGNNTKFFTSPEVSGLYFMNLIEGTKIISKRVLVE